MEKKRELAAILIADVVRYWHKADISQARGDVRFRG
jgi:hypothetical protein